MRCISGIHFNPLIEVVNYQLPDLSQCSVNSVYFSTIDKLCPPAELIADEFEDSFVLPELIYPCIVDSGIPCDHSFSFLPQIYVSVNSQKFCAIFDTGAEISLISLSAVMRMSDTMDVEINREALCSVFYFSGETTKISYTVDLTFKVGTYTMPTTHKFDHC